MTERDFQRIVVYALKLRGYIVWTVPNMTQTARGLPDVIAIHPNHPQRLLCYELKSERGRIRPEQEIALGALAMAKDVDARVIRPSYWADVLAEIEIRPATQEE